MPKIDPEVKALCAEYRMSNSGDPWGDVMGALFPICERLYFRSNFDDGEGEDEPADEIDLFLSSVVFRPPAVRDWAQYLAGECDEDGEHDGGNYWAQIARDTPTRPLIAFGRMLARLKDILDAAGKSY